MFLCLTRLFLLGFGTLEWKDEIFKDNFIVDLRRPFFTEVAGSNKLILTI